MKCAILAAITCCAIAGVAMGASSHRKQAATPAKKTAPVVVQKKGVTAPTGHPAVASSATKGGRTVTSATTKPGATKPGTPAAGVRTPSQTGTKTATRKYYGRQPGRRTYTAQQNTPTADRYREIQDALAAKGYLKTPSTGVWDKDSIDAMTRFQQDQKLDPTGKLTARSLGALGLGPKPAATESANPSASLGSSSTGEATPVQ